MNFIRTFRNINRLKEILFVIASHGFGKYLDDIYLSSLIGFGKKIITFGRYKRTSALPVEVRIREMLETLGPTFIKLGQMLSTRDDLIPAKLAQELSKLQDSVLSIPFEKINEKLKRIYKEPSKYFDYIEETPLAAASIAQVHRARLKNGQDVVLKIKREGIKEQVETDFAIALWIAKTAERYIEEAAELRISEYLEEFYNQLQKELDFEIEIAYMKRFKEFFKDNSKIVIPEVFEDISNDDVIVMSYHSGIPIDEIERLKKAGFDTKEIAEVGVDFYMQQVFDLHLFHGDPHPGNFVIDEKGRIVVFDFGIVGKIDRELLIHLSHLFKCLIEFDIEALVDEFVNFGIINEDQDIRKIKSELTDLLLPVYGKELERVNMKKSIERIFVIGKKFKFYFPKDYFLIMKTFMFLEATGRKLYPDFNMIEYAKEYAYKVIKHELSFDILLNDFKRLIADYKYVIENFPKNYKRLVKKIENAELGVNVIIKELDEYIKHHDRASNRLGFSIMIAFTVFSSTIMLIENFGPKIYGISAFGIAGLFASMMMGILLAIGYFKSGRL
ncbi:AarF/ABC1/UbiB kinase family protein [Deferribacter autotrophicus]|uniref:AarF/ABC1/UbiB kinase family protein n=1 Tax=Deferribacter autotrophicus TaxID=500465 RepID=A0A5A8F2K5_9BACT|nr:AarF/UbiB family protein [Deferribacter autotrophicus]KAA0257125.1 AarF/ABC1/UbiB kinase family protein [Deferribacter autotrophicus]